MKKHHMLSAAVLLALGLTLILLAGISQAAPPKVNRTASVPLSVANAVPTEAYLQDGCFRIAYLDTTYNADGTSSWRYEVEELGTGPACKDLSNWVLELPTCAPIVDAGPEPWEYVHPDPNFHMWGVKWETGDDFNEGEFWVTVDGHWATGETHVAVKSGDGTDAAVLMGPICTSYALTGTKTVESTEAGPGDTLTYTIVISNAGPTDAPGQVLDPIPTGTVYI